MERCRVFAVFFTAILISISAGAEPGSAARLEVVPPLIELDIRPGRAMSGVIVVSGDFDRPARIRVRPGDFEFGTHGEPAFYPPGTRPRSLSPWLVFNPAEFILSRERSQAVRYSLRVPEDVAGGYWGALFFETMPADEPYPGTLSVRTVIRLAAVLYASAARGGVLDGKLSGISAAYDGNLLVMSGRFENCGNLVAALTGAFELEEVQTGKKAVRADFGRAVVLPGGARELSAEWRGALPPGEYAPRLTVDYGRLVSARGDSVRH